MKEHSGCNKLTRNKNARHIFPYHFFPVAMIGIICLHMHFVLYSLNMLSIFSNTYTTSGNMTITAQNARARRALQPRGFSKQKMFLTLLRSFTDQKHAYRRISCIILNANANFETMQSIFGTFGSTLSQTSVY